MNLKGFVNRDIWAFLRGFRPLEGWEQLHIIYHSNRPLRAKLAAYETLLAEFSGDRELAKHLRRNITKVSYALDAPNREVKPGHFFRACSDIYELDQQGMIKGVYSDNDEGSFSTYDKAKRWLDSLRREAGECAPLYCNQYIIETVMDTNREVDYWRFDSQGRVCGFKDVDLRVRKIAESAPEGRYVHLPGVFAPGEILTVHPSESWRSGSGIAVAPDGYLSEIMGSDDTDVSVFVMYYHPESGTVGHDHWPLWAVERFTGELPGSQKVLNAISRHFKGEEHLDTKEITRLDPVGFFRWNDREGKA